MPEAPSTSAVVWTRAPSSAVTGGPASVPPGTTLSIGWVGDMTFGTYGSSPPGGVGTVFDKIRPYLITELLLGNLETVVGNVPPSKCSPGDVGCFSMVAPPETAQALKDAGFGGVNLANNHTHDSGSTGLATTKQALDDVGIAYTGLPGQITYVTANGLTVALLGFAPYYGLANALDIPEAVRLVKEAEQHAHIVIVMMHLGAEGSDRSHVRPGLEFYLGENRGDPVAFSHAVIDAGADLVVGSGPHVPRGMQWYQGRLIAYSVGDFSGYNTFPVTGLWGQSAILNITLDADGSYVTGSVTPLLLSSPGFPHVDLDATVINTMNALSSADFAGNGAAMIQDDGHIEPPPS